MRGDFLGPRYRGRTLHNDLKAKKIIVATSRPCSPAGFPRLVVIGFRKAQSFDPNGPAARTTRGNDLIQIGFVFKPTFQSGDRLEARNSCSARLTRVS